LGALKRTNGVQKRAAEILGINYRSLRHRLEKYGLLNSKSPVLADDSPARQ
jgi:DNA-binding NtrC family response regulator